MKHLPVIVAAVLTLGGIGIFALGLYERSGAYDTATMQKERLDKALKAWEAAAGTPEEPEKKARAVEITEYYKHDLESGSIREERGNLYLLVGMGLLVLNGIIFFLGRKLRKKPVPEKTPE
tara:strand:- start:13 stop:375 length:363 start_codon:yes stop_codon:yes gene_type:complete